MILSVFLSLYFIYSKLLFLTVYFIVQNCKSFNFLEKSNHLKFNQVYIYSEL
jgi:hypothetical protein